MDIVSSFAQSGDTAWDVSEENIEELIPAVNTTQNVVLVVTGRTMLIYKKDKIRVKVVGNGKSASNPE